VNWQDEEILFLIKQEGFVIREHLRIASVSTQFLFIDQSWVAHIGHIKECQFQAALCGLFPYADEMGGIIGMQVTGEPGDMQFAKAYLGPITTITGAIGWEAERRATLESFFV
jgi:hypothetical protein